MRLSKKTLENRFKTFNEIYFGGELIVPKFVIGGSKNTAGEFKCKYYTDFDDDDVEYATELVNIKIYFSKRLIKNSKILDNIMLHEMIHFYGYYMNYDIEGKHDEYFLNMAKKINEDGYKIKEFYEKDF